MFPGCGVIWTPWLLCDEVFLLAERSKARNTTAEASIPLKDVQNGFGRIVLPLVRTDSVWFFSCEVCIVHRIRLIFGELKKNYQKFQKWAEKSENPNQPAELLSSGIPSQQQAGPGSLSNSPTVTQVIISALLLVLFQNFQYTKW